MSKYNMEWLLEKVKAGETLDYVFFWGHQPKKDGTIGDSCLSQWYPASFEVDGVTYKSSEHWLMASKARLFKDDEMLGRILKSSSAAKAEKLGRLIYNVVDNVWGSTSFDLVKEGAVHKFGQNPALKEFLLGTGDAIIAEASPLDSAWAIGLARSHKHARQPENWKGANLLGFALMEARDELSKS